MAVAGLLSIRTGGHEDGRSPGQQEHCVYWNQPFTKREHFEQCQTLGATHRLYEKRQ